MTTKRTNVATTITAALAAAMATIAVAPGAVGGATVPATEPTTDTYRAEVVRDTGGVAHIVAGDWGSLGFGQGYALAEDRSCTLLDQIVKVRGERAEYLGAGPDGAYVASDFAYRHLGLWEDAPRRWAEQPERVRAVVSGYVAGFNAGLAEAGAGPACAGAAWVGPITEQDYYAVVSDVLLLASGQNLITEIGVAQPPDPTWFDVAAESTESPAGLRGLRPGGESPLGSNGWALGSERSSTGGGLLLGNPHFPWEGELRFWENHLVIPGELNVYGVSLTGLAGVQIGFNADVAWTHTVSSGKRFTLYRYELDPADPTVYLVDGEAVPMERQDHQVEVLGDDGSLTTVERTMYATKHGPVVDVSPLGWTDTQAIALADANAEIDNVLQQYLGMDTATSLDELRAVHAKFQGVPWVNTMAVSADGEAWYADVSATPNLSAEALAAWQAERDSGGLAALVFDAAGAVLLDGSDSRSDWVDDPVAPAPGLVPYADQAQLTRRDFVFNANDSHWLSNPAEPLTGFTPLQGAEQTPPSPRTRTNLLLLTETSEPWDLDAIQQALFSDRSVLVELLLAPLVQACADAPEVAGADGQPYDLGPACATLRGWDGTYAADATGAILFREWLSRFDAAERNGAGRLFADNFDPADPANTPAVPAADGDEWLRQLVGAAEFLTSAGVPIDAPLGDYQFDIRSGQRIPIHGGSAVDGVANIVSTGTRSSSTLAVADAGVSLAAESALRQLPDGRVGYPVTYGASFVFTVQYGPDGPTAEAVLTYGNPDDPADPAYSAGLTAYSGGVWRPLVFDEAALAELEADPTSSVIEVTAPK